MKITAKKYLSSGTLPKRALNTRFCPSYTTKDDFIRLFLLRQRTCDNFSIVGKQCLQPALVQLTRLAHTAQQSLLRSFLSLQVLSSVPKKPLNSRCLAAFHFSLLLEKSAFCHQIKEILMSNLMSKIRFFFDVKMRDTSHRKYHRYFAASYPAKKSYIASTFF